MRALPAGAGMPREQQPVLLHEPVHAFMVHRWLAKDPHLTVKQRADESMLEVPHFL
jgi:hypothetical protein